MVAAERGGNAWEVDVNVNDVEFRVVQQVVGDERQDQIFQDQGDRGLDLCLLAEERGHFLFGDLRLFRHKVVDFVLGGRGPGFHILQFRLADGADAWLDDVDDDVDDEVDVDVEEVVEVVLVVVEVELEVVIVFPIRS